ncbi:putative nucleotidyltransferase with HDIG domain [Ruminiclostridium sufflavum DSM 19573]|uniref:Putative nucleotidyltransferase with HDIG domain n=1 Tax=Ruminiclostridium sufflavum DSM 19573 TaxID=1121337 RepID=A0A318XLE6_9FIRM|nr:HD-GYP domain-containing protein [Ruminiclostridium sufflavum]PYG88453.1 putative nucleotidyltransferase with HDIG domain [Ruminiclostridium sufflavum DSM 19573]
MRYDYVKVSEDIIGSFLGGDVYTVGGNLIVTEDTLITDYILKKLISFGIEKIYTYRINTVRGDDYLRSNDISNDQKRYIGDVNKAKQLLQDLASGKKLDLGKAEDISENVYSKINDYSSLMDCVNTVKIADEYTYSHMVNVSVYSMLLGKWMGLSKEQIKDVILAGILHDVGKSQIPLEILNKKGSLNESEFEIMKKHAVYGYEIIKHNKDINMDVKRAVIMHHEKEDGSGYPFGIKGNQKNLYSKILTVADIFDAITSDRVYRRRQTPFEAFKELERIGYDVVDPKVMMAMLCNMPSYYVGSKVRMQNGEIGEVVYVPYQCAYAPVIKVNNSFYDFSYEKEVLISEFL